MFLERSDKLAAGYLRVEGDELIDENTGTIYTKSTRGTPSQLTIARTDERVLWMDDNLDLVIDRYWVEGNEVRCTGTVSWVPGNYRFVAYDAEVLMSISKGQADSVFVQVFVIMYDSFTYAYISSAIDTARVRVPVLGNGVDSFDFSLSCTYE